MKGATFALSVAVWSFASGGLAQETEGPAVPDIGDLAEVAIAFGGLNSADVKNPADFDLRNGMTLEAWVAPNWPGDLGYDPCVLTLKGKEDNLLSVTIAEDREHVGIMTESAYLTYPANLDAEAYNHLTVLFAGDYSEVFVNGLPSGLIDFKAPEGEVAAIDVGGCGFDGPSFVGWISNLRVWNAPLTLVDVLEFLPVTTNLDTEGHPYWPLLRAWMRSDGADGVEIATGASIFLEASR